MSEQDAPYLEALAQEPVSTDERAYVEPAYLEVARPSMAPEEPAEPDAPVARKRKVRASERRRGEPDAAWIAVMASLVGERPLLLALWPDASVAELLRDPPATARVRERADEAVRALDAIARSDASARARAEVAHHALQARLVKLPAGDGLGAGACDELRAFARREFLSALAVLGAGAKALRADDLRRVDVLARERGLSAEEARAMAHDEGFTWHEEASAWTPLDAMPGAPQGPEAAASAVLQHPLPALRALRGGVLERWLVANRAHDEMLGALAEARRLLERNAREGLVVHSVSWALGGRTLRASAVASIDTPAQIATLLRDRTLSTEVLTALAQEGTLAAWLRLHGHGSAAAASELVAQGVPSGLRRLGWTLGQPFWLRDRSFTDPAALARDVSRSKDLQGVLVESYASGDLLAWFESLPKAARPEEAIDAFRRGSARPDDTLPLWRWVFRTAQMRTLNVPSGRGRMIPLTALDALHVTHQVADLWDGLKFALRTGELHGWLSVHGFESALDLPRPPANEDVELNALLWELGHRGLVLEWGERDFAVNAPSDLVRAYLDDWAQLETQVRRGYVLAWLDRFHGDATVVGRVRITDVSAAFRAEIPRLPSGFVSLKLALLCGLRVLPLDPTRPGDAESCRGYVGIVNGPTTATAWEPLREHFAHGSAQLWLARLPDVGPRRGPTLAQSAFLDVPIDALDGDGTASTPPAAPSRGRSRKRNAAPAQRPVDATMARIAKTLGEPQPSPVLVAERAASATASSAPAQLSATSSTPPASAATDLARVLPTPPLVRHTPQVPPIVDAEIVEDDPPRPLRLAPPALHRWPSQTRPADAAQGPMTGPLPERFSRAWLTDPRVPPTTRVARALGVAAMWLVLSVVWVAVALAGGSS